MARTAVRFSMNAKITRRPPQRAHWSTSIPKTRLSAAAQSSRKGDGDGRHVGEGLLVDEEDRLLHRRGLLLLEEELAARRLTFAAWVREALEAARAARERQRRKEAMEELLSLASREAAAQVEVRRCVRFSAQKSDHQ